MCLCAWVCVSVSLYPCVHVHCTSTVCVCVCLYCMCVTIVFYSRSVQYVSHLVYYNPGEVSLISIYVIVIIIILYRPDEMYYRGIMSR